MKKAIAVLLLISASMLIKAQDTLVAGPPQDTLVLRNSTRIAAVILEIGTETVRYKKVGNPEGPDYTTHKSEVRYIILKNGIKETVDTLAGHPTAGASPAHGKSSGEMYSKGMFDAGIFYTRPCGAVGTGIATFATGIFGLIPAIIISAVPPKEKNLGYPSYELWKNKDYKAGYKRRAKKIKQKKVWNSFGVGIAASLVFAFLLLR